jgi:hypothetical protein
MLQPLYPRDRDPVPIVQEDGCGKVSSPPGFDAQNIQPVVNCYTDYAIPAHILLEGMEN